MVEIFVLFAILLAIFSVYIYFSTKSKDLSIKFLNEKEAKELFESFANESKFKLEEAEKELLRLKENFKNNQNLLEEKANVETELIEINIKLREKITKLSSTIDQKIKEATEAARADSVKRQRSILKGQATEQLAPYINSDYNPKDYKFIGDPIDYIVFDGMSDINSKEDEITNIVFMDIKTGKSQLNRVQRAVKKAIEEGRFKFQIYRPEKDIENDDN